MGQLITGLREIDSTFNHARLNPSSDSSHFDSTWWGMCIHWCHDFTSCGRKYVEYVFCIVNLFHMIWCNLVLEVFCNPLWPCDSKWRQKSWLTMAQVMADGTKAITWTNVDLPSKVQWQSIITLRWRDNDHAGVSNSQPHGCLLNRLFRRKSKKTSKLRVTGLCAGNSPGTGEFPAQMASYTENVSIWWRHHEGSISSMTACILRQLDMLDRKDEKTTNRLDCSTASMLPSSDYTSCSRTDRDPVPVGVLSSRRAEAMSST